MSAMTDYLENKLIDHLFRGVPYVAPTTLEFALLTAAPSDTAGGTEATGGAYARVPLATNATNFAATNAAGSTAATSSGTGGTTSNNVVITFPAPSASWGIVGWVALYDAHTAGNMLWWGPLAQAKTINGGDAAPSFAIGQLSIALDN